MAKRRIIDSHGLYFDTELVKNLGTEGLHLYICLWGLAEDWGGFECNPDDISLNTGALKISPEKVKNFIKNLRELHKILCYKKYGKIYGWLCKFPDHQTLNNPTPNHLPLPPWISMKIKYHKKSKRNIAEYKYDTSIIPVYDMKWDFDLDLDLKGKEKKGVDFDLKSPPEKTEPETPKSTPASSPLNSKTEPEFKTKRRDVENLVSDCLKGKEIPKCDT